MRMYVCLSVSRFTVVYEFSYHDTVVHESMNECVCVSVCVM